MNYDFWKEHVGNPHEADEPTYVWVEGPHYAYPDLPEFMHDVEVKFTIDNYGEPDTSAPLVCIREVTMNGEPLSHALYNEDQLTALVTAYVDSNPEPFQIAEGSDDT